MVADDDYIIEPGQTMTIKSLLLSNKYKRLNKKRTVLLELDQFFKDIDCGVDLLNDVGHIEESGFLVTNRTKAIIQISKYTKLEDVHVHFASKKSRVFKVLDLPFVNWLASTINTGDWDSWWRKVDNAHRGCNNLTKEAAKRPPEEPDQMIDNERIDALIRDMQASRWARYIIYDGK